MYINILEAWGLTQADSCHSRVDFPSSLPASVHPSLLAVKFLTMRIGRRH